MKKRLVPVENEPLKKAAAMAVFLLYQFGRFTSRDTGITSLKSLCECVSKKPGWQLTGCEFHQLLKMKKGCLNYF